MSLADEEEEREDPEEGDVIVEEKNSLDVVNRKTQEPERIRVIGEEEVKK